MTIAISIKVFDGVVLASDSASTLFAIDPDQSQSPPQVINVYNSANKICNLYKGLPIGCMFWGSGSIGDASISTLFKDLRKIFTDKHDGELAFNKENYSIEEIAQKIKLYIYDKLYKKEYASKPFKPALGILLSGYSSGQGMAEEWKIEIENGECSGPIKVRENNDVGIFWAGEAQAIHRLVHGFDTHLPDILRELGLSEKQINPALDKIQKDIFIPLVTPPMPIQDVIELIEFLVYVTIMFQRFAPGAPTVGGPIEIATITKHEGFKWIKRKHYYSAEYNQPFGPH